MPTGVRVAPLHWVTFSMIYWCINDYIHMQALKLSMHIWYFTWISLMFPCTKLSVRDCADWTLWHLLGLNFWFKRINKCWNYNFRSVTFAFRFKVWVIYSCIWFLGSIFLWQIIWPTSRSISVMCVESFRSSFHLNDTSNNVNNDNWRQRYDCPLHIHIQFSSTITTAYLKCCYILQIINDFK